jgi:hypothetical protein
MSFKNFLKNIMMGIKMAKFDAKFESGGKVPNNFLQKKDINIKVNKFEISV